MSEDRGATKQTASLVNSFLLFASLAISGFIGNETWTNGKKLEAIAASQITRTEFETKLLELRQEQNRLAIKLVDLEFAIKSMNARRSSSAPTVQPKGIP